MPNKSSCKIQENMPLSGSQTQRSWHDCSRVEPWQLVFFTDTWGDPTCRGTESTATHDAICYFQLLPYIGLASDPETSLPPVARHEGTPKPQDWFLLSKEKQPVSLLSLSLTPCLGAKTKQNKTTQTKHTTPNKIHLGQHTSTQNNICLNISAEQSEEKTQERGLWSLKLFPLMSSNVCQPRGNWHPPIKIQFFSKYSAWWSATGCGRQGHEEVYELIWEWL